jgi:hypothetical protein
MPDLTSPNTHLDPRCTCGAEGRNPDCRYGHACDASCPLHGSARVPEQARPASGVDLLERPAAVDLPPSPDLWQSYAGEAPAVYAVMFRQAADLLGRVGYDAHDDYEGARGISIAAALAEVALERAGAELEQGRAVYGDDQWARHLRAAADMWRRELEIRLGAVCYLTGQQLYDHSTHLTDVYRDLEKRWNHDAPPLDQGRAVGLLTTAADLLDILATTHTAARARADAIALEGK